MSTESNRCPRCDEEIDDRAALHLCQDRRQAHRESSTQDRTQRCDESLVETMPYPGDADSAEQVEEPLTDNESGFPEIDDLLGANLAHYRLDSLIGYGSMGRVYRARHLGLHRQCAIKVMNPGLVSRHPQIRERFWAEARAVANLVHPHVVTVHNLGSDRNYHFIEMEYVPGGISLKERLVREGPFESVRASVLVRQVVLALGAAHESGLVHRDVKPSNVLLTSDGRAKLADFGLVRRLSELELAGVPIAGTPTFMAPELFEGIPASHRSDLYAVGVMYYYLLSARLPFASDQISHLVHLHRNEPVPEIRRIAPQVPEVVSKILGRCLAKQPRERYDSADELADDLKSAVLHLRDTESLIRESVEGLNCFVQGGRDHYRILFQLSSERLQEVYLEVSQSVQGDRLLSIFSVCGPADPRHFEFALKLNAKLTYGSLSIRNVNGQPMFVMTRSYPRDHVNAADIRAALLEIARRGDKVEEQLFHVDLY
jgi:serine/threonine-protein kinase